MGNKAGTALFEDALSTELNYGDIVLFRDARSKKFTHVSLVVPGHVSGTLTLLESTIPTGVWTTSPQFIIKWRVLYDNHFDAAFVRRLDIERLPPIEVALRKFVVEVEGVCSHPTYADAVKEFITFNEYEPISTSFCAELVAEGEFN